MKYYFDYSATTPVDPEVLDEMLPYFSESFGNPSSIHSFGQEALSAITLSRQKIAKSLNCSFSEIYFTSGATESNNLALRGVLQKGDHLITTQIEHPSIFETARQLELKGVEVSYLPVNEQGIIDLVKFKQTIKENTKLVSVMFVNNEIGTIQPVKEVGKIIQEVNHKRKNKILFHIDAVQAIAYLDVDVQELSVDLLSISGHKIYGPKGVGVLYIRDGIAVESILSGGHQEKSIRPGTENVPGIVGLGKAIELLEIKKIKNLPELKSLRDFLIDELKNLVPDIIFNGSLEKRVANNINFSIAGIESERLLFLLDERGIAVSAGSACSSKSLKPSRVILALGKSKDIARSAIRISLGYNTKKQEIEYFLSTLKNILNVFI